MIAAVPRFRGEQHLVEVRQLQLVTAELPVALLRRVRRARRVSSGASGAAQVAELDHVAAGAAFTSSLVRPVFTDRGWSSASQPDTACSSCLWNSSHCSLPPGRASSNQREMTAQLFAEQIEVQIAGLGRGDRVGVVADAPTCPSPTR